MSKIMDKRLNEIEQAWKDGNLIDDSICQQSMTMEDVFACLGNPIRAMFERPNFC